MPNRILLCIIALVWLTPFAHAAKPELFAGDDGAINGYDPVAYFTEGKAVRGSDQHSFDWGGATFRFSSAENRQLFVDAPPKYAPQYGGYCAFAVSKGAVASTEPEAWSIVDGKLYLNYNLDVRERWREDTPGNIDAADKNWPGVLN